MFNVGIGEITLILVAALLVMGPDRLPEFARTLGKFLREFRRQTDDVRGVVMRELYKLEREVELDEVGPKPKPRLPAPSPVITSAVVPTPQAPVPVGDQAQPTTETATLASPVISPDASATEAVAQSAAGPDVVKATEAVQAAAASVSAEETARTIVPPRRMDDEPQVTYVGGVRIAPAVGTVARNVVRAPVSGASAATGVNGSPANGAPAPASSPSSPAAPQPAVASTVTAPSVAGAHAEDEPS
jgi:sec-independent protein translocase protein TatB